MKILIVQLRRIGDILLTTPVVWGLRKKFPDAQIDFLVEPMGLSVLETNPDISEVLVYGKTNGLAEIFRIRKRRYDVVLDFLNNPRTSYLTGFSGAKWRVGFKKPLRSFLYNLPVPIPFEPEYVPKRKIRLANEWLKEMAKTALEPSGLRPRLFLNNEDRQFAEDWIKSEQLQGRSFAIIAPASRRQKRQWRPEGYRSVALSLKDNLKVQAYLVWGPGEEKLVDEIRRGHEDKILALPKTTVRQMAAIIKKSRLLFSTDSAAMHSAVAMGTPTVTIYGPTRPIDWNPSLVEKKEIPTDIPIVDLENVTADQVIEACKILIKGGLYV